MEAGVASVDEVPAKDFPTGRQKLFAFKAGRSVITIGPKCSSLVKLP